MSEQSRTVRRRNRVFKSLHKPLTYLGVERTLFFFFCVSAVGVFNLFNSLLAGIGVFIGGFAFGHWVTNTDPELCEYRLERSACLPASLSPFPATTATQKRFQIEPVLTA